MLTIEHELNRYLTLLRNKIRERGFTQLEVQDALGWGRSYISQLLTKQKSLRVEQVLLILSVIGIEPPELYAEIYGYRLPTATSHTTSPSSAETDQAIQELRRELHGLVEVLLERRIITTEELSAAVRSANRDSEEA